MSDLPPDAGVDDEPIEPDEPELELEDTEGEEPEAPEGEEPEAPAAVAPLRRGSARVQALANENRELKTKLTGFEQQLQGLLRDRQQPSPAEQAAAAQAERERFELMSPWEQAQYTERKITEGVQRQSQQLAYGVWDQGDKRAFDDELRVSPEYRRYEARVEELRKMAPSVSRIDLLDKAIGEYARLHKGAARTRAGKADAANAARQNVRPPGGGSDVPGRAARDPSAARDARLRAAGIIA